MKKTIFKTNCIIISIAIMLQMTGNPTTVKAADPVKGQKTANTLMYVAIGCLVVGVIIAIASKNKKKKQHTNLQQRMNYSKFYISTPIDYKLVAAKQDKAKQNDFVVHFLKSNSWTSPASNSNIKTGLPDFSFEKKWDNDFFIPNHKLLTYNLKISGYNF
ncbi:MAG: hypothetical protein H8D45_29865 [Bacteroidetes bacterium]|nr:hypothetical protein [Bacteroidota bacterium]MBL7102894.1 hypothetical protein [Bacteroidales bacterium]